MRVIMIALASGVLAGCAAEAQRTDAAPPLVSYSYSDAEGLKQATRDADDWCDDNYDLEAQLVESVDAYGDATFACVED